MILQPPLPKERGTACLHLPRHGGQAPAHAGETSALAEHNGRKLVSAEAPDLDLAADGGRANPTLPASKASCRTSRSQRALPRLSASFSRSSRASRSRISSVWMPLSGYARQARLRLWFPAVAYHAARLAVASRLRTGGFKAS
mgnify:CR=1 FL=1